MRKLNKNEIESMRKVVSRFLGRYETLKAFNWLWEHEGFDEDGRELFVEYFYQDPFTICFIHRDGQITPGAAKRCRYGKQVDPVDKERGELLSFNRAVRELLYNDGLSQYVKLEPIVMKLEWECLWEELEK